MTNRPPVLLLLIVSTVSTAYPQSRKEFPATDVKAVLLPVSKVPWKDNPDLKGARGAPLWSAADKTSSDAFGRFPAGFVEGNEFTPVHVHDFGFKLVVLEGTLAVVVEGASPVELGPGSYGNVPPSMKHSVACRQGADCVYFITYWRRKP